MHGHNELDVHVHVLLTSYAFCCFALAFWEIFTASKQFEEVSFGLAWLRNLFVLLQGSRFYQIGFVLFNPFSDNGYDWSQEEFKHRVMMNTNSYFVIHFFLNACLLIFLSFVAHMRAVAIDINANYSAFSMEKYVTVSEDIKLISDTEVQENPQDSDEKSIW